MNVTVGTSNVHVRFSMSVSETDKLGVIIGSRSRSSFSLEIQSRHEINRDDRC